MSSRPSVKSAFEGLRPSIVREPSRTLIAPQDESKLLDITEPAIAGGASASPTPPESFTRATLLSKKKREVLIPVTFRIPQSLKEKLSEVAKRHELNQTDLINEGIQLNLQRYI